MWAVPLFQPAKQLTVVCAAAYLLLKDTVRHTHTYTHTSTVQPSQSINTHAHHHIAAETLVGRQLSSLVVDVSGIDVFLEKCRATSAEDFHNGLVRARKL
jgi:hypothetical protein